MNASIIYERAGQYEVSLKVTDSNELTNEAVVTVNVTTNKPPTAIATSNISSGRAPLEVAFVGSASSDDVAIETYAWEFDDGTTSNEINPIHIFATAGSYEVSLTVTDNKGISSSAGIIITVTGNEAPIAIAGSNKTEGQSPLTVNFSSIGSSDDSGITNYLWDFGTGDSSTDPNPTYTYSLLGTFSAKLTVMDAEGLTDEGVVTITVSDDTSNPPIAITSSDVNSGNAPLTVSFKGSASTNGNGTTENLSYSWNFKDGTSISTEADPVHTFDSSGTYYVTLTVTNQAGLSDVETIIITAISSSNTAPIANAKADNTTGPAPFKVNFDGSTSSDDTGISSYLWDFGDGEISNEANPEHTFITEGDYTVTLTVTDIGGLTDEASLIISATEILNTAPIAVASSNITSGEAPLTVNFVGSESTDDKGAANLDYFWDFKDGSVASTGTSDLQDPLHTFNTPGTYLVILKVTDAEGLSDTATLTINVNEVEVENSAPTAVADSDVASGDAPLTVNFTGSGSTDDAGIAGYSWDFGDGSEVSTEADPTYIFTEVGDYTVTLTVTDAEGLSDTATLTINVNEVEVVNQAPDAVAASDVISGDAPLTVNFTGSGSTDDAGIASYSWDFSDGSAVSTEADPTHIFNTVGDFEVLLTVTDAEGLSDTATLTINVNEVEVVNQAPDAVAASDILSGDAPLTVNFTGSSSTDDDGIASYSWDFGDGSEVSTEADPAHIFTEVGDYTVTLTVTDAEGLSDTATLTINVNEVEVVNQAPVAIAASDVLSGDAPLTVNFMGSGSTDDAGMDNLTYSWDFGDGSEVSTKADPAHIFTEVGDYTVTLTVTDAEGLSDTATLTINVNEVEVVNQAPDAVAGSDILSGDAPLTVNFTGSGSTDDDGIVSYSWDFGDGSEISTEADPAHIFTEVGDYTVTLTVTDSEGLSDTATLTINVNEVEVVNQAPDAVAASDILSGDAPLTVNFTGSSSTDDDGIASYSWDFGDGSEVSTEADPAHIFTEVGDYTVTLTVTDAEGLSDTDTIIITVAEAEDINQAPIAILGSDVTAGIAPLTVNFTGSSSTDDDSIVSYSWDFGDGSSVSTEADPTHIFNTVGDFEVLLTVTDSEGLSDTATLTIRVKLFNKPPKAILISSVTSGGMPLEVEFNGSNSYDDISIAEYEWDFGDESTVSNLADPIHIFNEVGIYEVSLTVTDGSGLTNTATTTIEVTASLSVETQDISKYKLILYPNPARSSVNIEINSPSLIPLEEILIHDLRGRLAVKYDPNEVQNGSKYLLPLPQLQSGVYLISIIDKNGSINRQRLVIEN